MVRERSDRIFELQREKQAFLVMPQRKFLHRFSAGLSKGSFKHVLYRGPGPLAIRWTWRALTSQSPVATAVSQRVALGEFSRGDSWWGRRWSLKRWSVLPGLLLGRAVRGTGKCSYQWLAPLWRFYELSYKISPTKAVVLGELWQPGHGLFFTQ